MVNYDGRYAGLALTIFVFGLPLLAPRLTGLGAVVDECGDDADAPSADDLIAGGYQRGGNPPTLMIRVDGQTVDPTLATVMCAQDHAHDPLSNRRGQVEVGELFELLEERRLALAALGFGVHAAKGPERNEPLVVVRGHPPDAEQTWFVRRRHVQESPACRCSNRSCDKSKSAWAMMAGMMDRRQIVTKLNTRERIATMTKAD